jgi:hypothetical protein
LSAHEYHNFYLLFWCHLIGKNHLTYAIKLLTERVNDLSGAWRA